MGINGYIQPSDYQAEFGKIISATKGLLSKQLETHKQATEQEKAKAKAAEAVAKSKGS